MGNGEERSCGSRDKHGECVKEFLFYSLLCRRETRYNYLLAVIKYTPVSLKRRRPRRDGGRWQAVDLRPGKKIERVEAKCWFFATDMEIIFTAESLWRCRS